MTIVNNRCTVVNVDKTKRGDTMNTKLSDVMYKKKVSTVQLAEHLEKSRQTVSMIKNGRASTSIENWKKIADYLQVDINEII